MRKEFLGISVIVLFTLIGGCNNSNKNPIVPALKPFKIMVKFGDSTYFSGAWNIQKNKNHFFIDDEENHRVLKLDSTLKLQNTFGKQGKGPGEFQYAGSITANGDSLYIYDDGALRFNVYGVDGHYIRSFKAIHTLRRSRLAIIDNRLYMSSSTIYNHSSSIFITNLNGKLIKYFKKDSQSPPEINTSSRLLFSTPNKQQIIAVSKSIPYIERYTSNGKFLESFNLQKIQILDPLWHSYKVEKSKNTRHHKHILFTDAYMYGTSLYIMTSGWSTRDNYTYILKLAINNKTIKPVSVFKIQGSSKRMDLFNTIAITDHNTLVAADLYTKAICEFDLSQLK